MTAPSIVLEYDVCIDCQGSGAIPTGEREYETGMAITRPCPSCDEGTVDAQWVSECTNCETKFWRGDGCTHGDTLCVDCRPNCAECVQDRRDDADYEGYREYVRFGGAA